MRGRTPTAHTATERAGTPAPLGRDQLAVLAGAIGDASGWLTCSADGRLQIALRASEVDEARRITATCLEAAGVRDHDRVVVALNSDGAGVGVLWSEAAASICAAATVTRPDGTRRLLGRLAAASASTLVCTPTAARQLADAVANEPDLDPHLRRIILVGEIVGRPDTNSIATALNCLLSEVWPDPIFGVALAWRDALTTTSFRRVDATLVDCAPITASAAEWVVHPHWCDDLSGISYRSGLVSASSDPNVLDRPRWTRGDHLLVRGRWFSCGSLERTLDHLAVRHWQLRVRRYGAGEQIELIVDDTAPTAGLDSALRAITPLRVDITHDRLPDNAPRLHDERGHHLDQPFTTRELHPTPRR